MGTDFTNRIRNATTEGGTPDTDALLQRAHRLRRRRVLTTLATAAALPAIVVLALAVMVPDRSVEFAPATPTSTGEAASSPSPPAASPSPTVDTDHPPCDDEAGTQPPDEAEAVRGHRADMRGDGLPDHAWVYVEAGEVFVHVAFAAGGSDRLRIDAMTDGVAEVIVSTDVDGDGGDELWVNVGAASAPLMGVVTVKDCRVQEVTTEDGQPLRLWTGGSPDEVAGVRCIRDAIEVARFRPHTAEDGTPLFDEPGQLTTWIYELEDSTAVLVDERQTASEAPSYIGDISCGTRPR